jgi:hypothetical protein
MRIFRIAEISIFIFSVLIFNTIFAQTPFHYDTLKISFGYVIPDYRKTLAKDTTDSDFLILCPALYKSDIDPNNVDIYSHLTTAPQPGEFYVGRLPNRFVDSCFVDKPGDTLVLLGGFGTNKAVISEIDYMEQGDITRIYCLLKLVKSISPLAKMGPFVAVRPEGRGHILGFECTTASESQELRTITDSTKIKYLKSYIGSHEQVLSKKDRDEIFKHALDSGYCEITIYTYLFAMLSSVSRYHNNIIVANLGPKIPDIWPSVFQIKGIRSATPVLNVSSYGKIIDLVCTFDLNGDNKAEYLVTEQEEELRSIIYSDSDSGWVPVASGDATWQE